MQQLHARRARRGRPYVLAAALLAAALLMVLAAPAAFAAGATCTLSAATVDYGQPVTVTGVIDPVAAGQPVAVALDGVAVAGATTDAAGQYAASFTPAKGGSVTAVLADGTSSAPVALAVRPVVSVKVLRVAFWSSVTMSIEISPDTYAGPIGVHVIHHGRTVGAVLVTAEGKLTTVRVPITGVGPFSIKVSVPAANGLLAQDASGAFTVRAHRVVAGSRGERVRVLLRALAALHFRVPGVSSSMSTAGAEAVVAFQKAYGLPRTYVFDNDDWRKLETATLLKPRYSKPALHIEIDKTRQILMVVRNGTPLGILAVSTGATGNTPEGTHRIQWKAYCAPTPYGGLLYWDMEFAPSFAMHAYPSVPPYPASHGCVRQPNWVAPWTYSVSSVGETVYVFH
jgi:lipoprotein-anchoring transpeptidase ErfK/SrfK